MDVDTLAARGDGVLSLGQIRAALRAFEMFDPRFPLRATRDGTLIRATGPRDYVEHDSRP